METFKPYYTVVIPWVPSQFRTEWHPLEQDKGGPFDDITRGSFETQGKAIEWAQVRLNGAPYSVRLVTE